jgi:hypothetical protein
MYFAYNEGFLICGVDEVVISEEFGLKVMSMKYSDFFPLDSGGSFSN